MTQLKNAKLKFEGDKLLLIDAPDDSMLDYDKIEYEQAYYEALSKAPTWEIKNREEVVKLLFTPFEDLTDLFFDGKHWFWSKWTEEGERIAPRKYLDMKQGKLYDVPKSYKIKFEKKALTWDDFGNTHNYKEFAILIPQEEVKGENQDDLFELLREFVGASDSERWQIAKSKFKITRR